MVEQDGKKINEGRKRRKRRASVCNWVTFASAHLVEDAYDGDTQSTPDGLRYDMECFWKEIRFGESDARFVFRAKER